MTNCYLSPVLLALALAPGDARAQFTPTLLAGNFSGNGAPADLADRYGLVFFDATDYRGNELWATDGTAAGTYLVKDVAPGAGSGVNGSVVAVGNVVYFPGRTGNDTELWKSDGTAAGTVLAVDVWPGPIGSAPRTMIAYDNGLCFTGLTPPTATARLFRSDGTPAGTVDIGPGVFTGVMVESGGRLFYLGDYPPFGVELLVTDGTAAGTTLVKDIHPPQWSWYPEFLTAHDGQLFFSANVGPGHELWISDGTSAGTNPLGVATGRPLYVTSAGPFVYFSALGTLWRTDGTVANTIPLPGANPQSLTAVGDKLVFQATSATNGVELWCSDGTVAGTARVVDIGPNALTSQPTGGFVTIGSRAYFNATTAAFGKELWSTDGTAAGTQLFVDHTAGATGSTTEVVGRARGQVLYVATTSLPTRHHLWAAAGHANVQSVGNSCAVPGRSPTLRAQDPILGGSWALFGDDAYIGSFGATVLGFRPALPVPILGCEAYLDPNVTVPLPLFMASTANWNQSLTLPASPGLAGVLMVAQGVFLGTDRPGYAIDLTNGLYLYFAP